MGEKYMLTPHSMGKDREDDEFPVNIISFLFKPKFRSRSLNECTKKILKLKNQLRI